MNLIFGQNIKTVINDETFKILNGAVETEFNKISESTRLVNGKLEAKSINASFGSILRDDITVVSIEEKNNKDGYVINCETEYKPSVVFWIFCVIDFVLITTLIGFILGFGATLGLYFYNKSLVEKAIKDALDKIKQNYE